MGQLVRFTMFRRDNNESFARTPLWQSWMVLPNPLAYPAYRYPMNMPYQQRENQVALQAPVNLIIPLPQYVPYQPYYPYYFYQPQSDNRNSRPQYDDRHRPRNDHYERRHHSNDRPHERDERRHSSKRKHQKSPEPVQDEQQQLQQIDDDVVSPKNKHQRLYNVADRLENTEQSEAMKEQQRQTARRLQSENKIKKISLAQAIQENKTYQNYIAEEISEALEEKSLGHADVHSAFHASDTAFNQDVYARNQKILLKKINAYLSIIGGQQIPERGYCNGIIILWLTMMASNTENLFYDMVDCIAACPKDKLEDIHETILTFLEWIEIGQHPRDHFGEECKQHELHKIIGADYVGSHQNRTSRVELAKLIDDHAKPGAMVCLQGWSNTIKDNEEIGHTIGLFNRNGAYYLFDPNYCEGRPRDVFKPRLVPEIWDRLYNLSVQTKTNDQPYMRVSSAIEKRLSQARVSKGGLFGRNDGSSSSSSTSQHYHSNNAAPAITEALSVGYNRR
jgi:hypothetical protein